MVVLHPPAKFERRRETLKQRGKLLNRRNRGIVIGSLRVPLPVFVAQGFRSRERDLLPGIDPAGEIVGALCRIEDLRAGGLRHLEFQAKGFPVFGFRRELAVGGIDRVAVRPDGNRKVLGLGAGEVERETDRGNEVRLRVRQQLTADAQQEQCQANCGGSQNQGRPGKSPGRHAKEIMPKKSLQLKSNSAENPQPPATRWRSSVAAVCRWQMAMARASAASAGSGVSARFSSRVTMCCTCCFSARP